MLNCSAVGPVALERSTSKFRLMFDSNRRVLLSGVGAGVGHFGRVVSGVGAGVEPETGSDWQSSNDTLVLTISATVTP